jgi:hypothetical protein
MRAIADSPGEKKNKQQVGLKLTHAGVTSRKGERAKETIVPMTKTELEAFLREFDEALVQAFPGPEPMSVLLVGGACFLLQGITAQPTDSVDVIILEMLGSPECTLVFHSPVADKIRRITRAIGKRHGLKGERQQFFNDDVALFLLELSEQELPPMCLLQAYRKLHLYVPRDLGYLLACKLMLGRPEKDGADIAVLRQVLAIQNRAQAQQLVDRYFPSPAQQATYRLPCILERMFEK